ncbi:unnamed protein product [Hyaloperonospora brassicae]|uniref:Helicase C-terminal domain-containing protein n=1 Tax=Hyaloperonospora brassicae TaxID=162125 RepID=A0AAV0T8P5_HYABA|nr:unnamed protein product [Hyaloperonospora brassicae]
MTRARPKRLRTDSLVVVNAFTLQQSSAASNDHKTPPNEQLLCHKQLPTTRTNGSTRRTRARSKRPQQRQDDDVIGQNVDASCPVKLANTVRAPGSVLEVKSAVDVEAGVYYVLLTRTTSRACVVALPNRGETSPAQLAGMLKLLGLQAVALHGKMTGQQRHDTVQRLRASKSLLSSPLHAMVLVTTDKLLASTTCATADVALVDAVSAQAVQVATSKFAHVYHVATAANAGLAGTQELLNSKRFLLELVTTPCLQQLQKRLKLARQVVDIAQRAGNTSATGAAAMGDVDKWAQKLAKGAGLDDDDDEEAAGGRKKKRKRAMSPDEQRVQALTEKLYVALARGLPGMNAKSAGVPTSGKQTCDSQHRGEKLQVLGLGTVNAAVGTAMTDKRTSAQTRWMDFAEGRQYGGQWEGSVRHGASKDKNSLALREKVCAARSKVQGSTHLSRWMPNKEPIDIEKWGGAFGKVCGHNEVVMNDLRAFYPQEVLNSKVCSKLFPAPGNQGFDGCLEHLRLACVAQHSSMTVWDSDYFVFISSRGRVTMSKKSQLLPLSLASLQCLVSALRDWTATSGGHMPPSAVLCAIRLCCQFGYGGKQGKLPLTALKRIMSYALGGSVRLWRQIATVPIPLEEETVYESE